MPKESSFEDTLGRLFESELGINREEVTLGYIRDARARRQYPQDNASDFGGRTNDDLAEIDDDEAAELMKEVDELIEESSSSAK